MKKRRKLVRKRSTPPPTVNRMLYPLNVGDRVVVDIHPSVQEGRPHLRFNGRIGVVVGRQGSAYIVEVKDGNKPKKIITAPIHVRRLA